METIQGPFADLKMDGAYISEVTLAPLKMVRLRLFRGPRGDGERQVAEEFELVIGNLRHFSLAVEADPWLEIISHEAHEESDFMRDYLNGPGGGEGAAAGADAANMRHYRIVCVRGTLDIIGGQFICYLVNETPFFKSA